MAFTATHIDNNVKKEQTTTLSPSQLNTKVIEMLLSLIKRSTFLGEDVETIYHMVVKLQNQYLEQTK